MHIFKVNYAVTLFDFFQFNFTPLTLNNFLFFQPLPLFSDLIPVENNEQIMRFLKDDEGLEDRKQQLANHMMRYAPTEGKYSLFASKLCRLVFHFLYRLNHVWPDPK